MKRRLLFVWPLLVVVSGIKVPVDNSEEIQDTSSEDSRNQTQSKPVYYTSDEAVDSYLIPPDPHKPAEVLPDNIVTPATYLLPPTDEKQPAYFYAPTESGEQSDWYPIAQQPEQQTPQGILLPPKPQSSAIPIFFVANQTRSGKVLGDRINIPIPSAKLEPPAEDAPNDYIIQAPSTELELPAEEIDQQYLPIHKNTKAGQPINPHHIPPKHIRKYKLPTKLYPKKFNGGFKPVPIPIAQFADDSQEVPLAKPAKYFKPLPSIEGLPVSYEKKIYLFEQAEQKRKLKDSLQVQDQQEIAPGEYIEDPASEQDVSESHYRYPTSNLYPPPAPYNAIVPLRGPPVPLRGHPVPLRGPPAPLRGHPVPLRVEPEQLPAAPSAEPEVQAQNTQPQAPPAPDDRTEFRMHGMKGPHSYQFGYDTGKGKNRQFRYEERDNDGLVHGHYGYVDRHGKLRVVKYRAHPEHGFQADTQEENKE